MTYLSNRPFSRATRESEAERMEPPSQERSLVWLLVVMLFCIGSLAIAAGLYKSFTFSTNVIEHTAGGLSG